MFFTTHVFYKARSAKRKILHSFLIKYSCWELAPPPAPTEGTDISGYRAWVDVPRSKCKRLHMHSGGVRNAAYCTPPTQMPGASQHLMAWMTVFIQIEAQPTQPPFGGHSDHKSGKGRDQTAQCPKETTCPKQHSSHHIQLNPDTLSTSIQDNHLAAKLNLPNRRQILQPITHNPNFHWTTHPNASSTNQAMLKASEPGSQETQSMALITEINTT